MGYTPVTPFRRAVTYTQLAHQKILETPLPPQGVNKYEVLRELAHARVAFGLSDRDMTVLQALVSFYQGAILGGNSDDLIVFPSNRALCERLNGMPCSTMRRHLAALVQAGIVVRRDSPNGKRYTRRASTETGETQAFGFDLAPLALRFEEFCAAAELRRADEEAFARLRESVSLMRRDLAALVEYGRDLRPDLGLWDQLSDLGVLTARNLRRRLDMMDLEAIAADLTCGLNAARTVIEPSETKEMSTKESGNEQHYQNSNTDTYDSELRLEKAKVDNVVLKTKEPVHIGTVEVSNMRRPAESSGAVSPRAVQPNLPIGLVLSVCSEIRAYAEDPIKHWHELVRAADLVRPMMGISPSAWDEARQVMGPEQAAVVLAAMLERFSEIRSPGGYLRSLVAKAEQGMFSVGPMVMALMRKAA